MQLGDRGYEAESQPHAGRPATGVAPIEALDYLRFLVVADARAVVANDDLDRLVDTLPRSDRDPSVFLPVLERVVDQVRHRLGQQQRVASKGELTEELERERSALELCHRLVELGDVACDLACIDRNESRTPRAGVDLGQSEQRVEDGDHAI